MSKRETAAVTASAPGSVMLLGEHAVLHGYHALVAAVNYRCDVSLSFRDDDHVVIDSSLGQYKEHLSDLVVEKPFEFILATLKQFKLTRGVTVNVTSSFSHQVGLGSSAAITVAVVCALRQLLGLFTEPFTLYQDALAIVRLVQKGRGSGADVAASVYGGVILYRINPFLVEPISLPFEIGLCYVGYKTPTTEVLMLIETRFANRQKMLATIYRMMGDIVQRAIRALRANNKADFVACVKEYQTQLVRLGVSDKVMDEIIYRLSQDNAISCAKISGAGLGDCVVAFGHVTQSSLTSDKRYIPVSVESIGAKNG